VIDRPQEKNATLLESDGPVELAAGPAIKSIVIKTVPLQSGEIEHFVMAITSPSRHRVSRPKDEGRRHKKRAEHVTAGKSCPSGPKVLAPQEHRGREPRHNIRTVAGFSFGLNVKRAQPAARQQKA